MNSVERWAAAGLGLMAAAVFSATAQAAVVVFDFTTSGGTVTGSGFNTVRTYSGGGVTLTARGFSLLGNSNIFSASQVGQFNNAGLGVCNQNEGTGCSSPNHQVDNQGGSLDFALFQLDPAVTITSVFVRTFDSDDTDVSYYLGNAANPLNLTGVNIGSLGGLGFSGQQVDNSSAGTNKVAINAGPFNSLLFGAQRGEDNDAFKIQTLTINYTPVPEPMTMTLLGTGLLGLGLVARRRRRA